MKNVIFISDMYLSTKLRSSTQIMTDNIIHGFLENGYELILILIGDKSEKDLIYRRYNKCKRCFLLETRVSKGSTKYDVLYRAWRNELIGINISSELNKIVDQMDINDTVLISHSPSLESIFIAKSIRKKKNFKYIEYWSDPMTLSGILPDNYNLKRFPFYVLEKRLLKYADEIVYGTKTLLHFQKDMFKTLSWKMRYVDVAYTPKSLTAIHREAKILNILYSGNYYSEIRNIEPLYKAMKQLSIENYHLAVYGNGDITLSNTDNVSVHGRVSSYEIQEIEKNADLIVCILNKDCIQVPGKIFYNCDLDQRILVIVDGKYGIQIKDDLSESGRFEFCNNAVDDIVDYLSKIQYSFIYDIESISKRFSPCEVSKRIING